jgi:hypothetical protein
MRNRNRNRNDDDEDEENFFEYLLFEKAGKYDSVIFDYAKEKFIRLIN